MKLRFEFNPLVTVRIVVNEVLPLAVGDDFGADTIPPCIYNIATRFETGDDFEPLSSIRFNTKEGVYIVYPLVVSSCEQLTILKDQIARDTRNHGGVVLHNRSERAYKKTISDPAYPICYWCLFYLFYQDFFNGKLIELGKGNLIKFR